MLLLRRAGLWAPPAACVFRAALFSRKKVQKLCARVFSFVREYGMIKSTAFHIPQKSPCDFCGSPESPQSPQVRRCVPRGLTARLASPLPTKIADAIFVGSPGSLKRFLREPYDSLSHGVSSTTPPSCLRQDTSPYTGEAKMR